MCFKPKMPAVAPPAVAPPQKSLVRADTAEVKNTDVATVTGGREASGRVGLGTEARKKRAANGLVI